MRLRSIKPAAEPQLLRRRRLESRRQPSEAAPVTRARPIERIEAIDLARGIAILLMILSHGVKGLLTFEQIPGWGMVPVHLLTKISSTLFILVFGVSLAVAFVPHAGTPRWPEKRKKLLIRGLVVLFWYKALTIVEMFHLYPREQVLDTLLYRAFPVYVEILGFYAIALLWAPWILPLWKKSPSWLRWLSPVALAGVSWYLSSRVDFSGHETLKALLVEHDDHYAWGQISRGPLILAGLLLGGLILGTGSDSGGRLKVTAGMAVAAAAFLGLFAIGAEAVGFRAALQSIAKNEGKHPPELLFMLFSGGGAMLVLSLALLGGGRLASFLGPVTLIGKNSLRAFVFHILVIFVFYRYLFDLFHKTTYPVALGATALLIGLTVLWIKLLQWTRNSD